MKHILQTIETKGIYSSFVRPAEKNERRYSLFDGDVDALWIENMNSVMDDNKLLTLANGERIRLAPYCSLLFEVGDLNYASPATVSRAGMVFVDPKNLGYQPYWDRFVFLLIRSYEFIILVFFLILWDGFLSEHIPEYIP